MLRYLWSLLLLGPCALYAATLPGATQITAVTLNNGMQIIVWPDHDIPNVTLYNFVRVGSRNEVPGKTGLAHFFEHMMFNGTATHAQGEFDRIMEAAGGSNNASTDEDATIYKDWFPRSAMQTVFELEADRLQHLAFIPEVVESERGVVYSERRLRVEGDNESKLAEQVQATAFLAHPYGAPVIGWPSDIKSWTLSDLQQFFTTNYAPNNCTLVITGDVQPAEVLALAKQYLEPIPAQPAAESLRSREPEQEGERRITLALPAQTPLLQFAYHSPQTDDAQVPALELLLRILADGESSRLYQRLVEHDKLAIAVKAEMKRGFDPGLIWFLLSLPAQADINAVEQAFDAELQRVITAGVTATELNKARNIVLSEFWRNLSTIDGKADALGYYAVFHHDYRHLFDMPDVYAKVTAADLQHVAKTILQSRNRTVGVLVPVSDSDSDADVKETK